MPQYLPDGFIMECLSWNDGVGMDLFGWRTSVLNWPATRQLFTTVLLGAEERVAKERVAEERPGWNFQIFFKERAMLEIWR